MTGSLKKRHYMIGNKKKQPNVSRFQPHLFRIFICAYFCSWKFLAVIAVILVMAKKKAVARCDMPMCFAGT